MDENRNDKPQEKIYHRVTETQRKRMGYRFRRLVATLTRNLLRFRFAYRK